MELNAPHKIILKVRTGSHCHGTNLPESDEDVRGIMIPDVEYFMGLQTFEQWKNPAAKDEEYYDIRKFFKLAIIGNFSALNILFTRDKDLLYVHPLGQKILDFRQEFMSMTVISSIHGYCKSQLHKMHIGRGRAGNREDLVHKHGYDTKFGYHALMLTYLGIDILKTGTYRTYLPIDQQKDVMRVRKGEMPYEECMKRIHGNLIVMKTLEPMSPLKLAPDRDKIYRFLTKLLVDNFYTDIINYDRWPSSSNI